MNKDIEYADDIDLKELFSIIFNGKYIIVAITSIAAVLSVLYSLSLPNIYTSEALLIEANEKTSLSSKLGAMSPFADLAGISMPSELSKSAEAVKRIGTFDFFSQHVLPYIELENLLAIDKWVPEGDLILYDEKLFNELEDKWVRKKQPTIPSTQEAYRRYKQSVLSISQDRKTGFVTLSIKHQSPFIAKKWAELIIKSINSSMREEDNQLATRSIVFLTDQAANSILKESKDAISQLIEAQIHDLMIVAASENYIFRVLDSPIAPDKKTSPSRATICIIGTIMGGIFGILLVFLMHFRKNFYVNQN